MRIFFRTGIPNCCSFFRADLAISREQTVGSCGLEICHSHGRDIPSDIKSFARQSFAWNDAANGYSDGSSPQYEYSCERLGGCGQRTRRIRLFLPYVALYHFTQTNSVYPAITSEKWAIIAHYCTSFALLLARVFK